MNGPECSKICVESNVGDNEISVATSLIYASSAPVTAAGGGGAEQELREPVSSTANVIPKILSSIQVLPFTCEICQATFTKQFSFYNHLKNHYENVTSGEVQEQESQVGVLEARNVALCDSSSVSKRQPKEEVSRKTHKATKTCVRKPKKSKTLKASEKVGSKIKKTSRAASDPPAIVLEEVSNKSIKLDENLADIVGKNLEISDNADLEYESFLDDHHDGLDDDEEETEMMYLQSNMCPTCDEHCETKENLEKHMWDKHPEIYLIPSENENDQKFAANSSLATTESQAKPELKCQVCHRIFNHRNSLVYHMRSHTGERPFPCDVCGKRFFATSALKVHKRLHSGEKPYTCDECGRDFRQWGDLKYHKISIHSEERAHQCEFCGKSFARKYSLIVHRRIHTKERNYMCDFCNKTFRAASYLKNHRRIHTGEKPHTCTVCNKAFRVRSDMKRHMSCHERNLRAAQKLAGNALSIAPVASSTSGALDPKITTTMMTSLVTGGENTATVPVQVAQLPIIATSITNATVLTKESLVDDNCSSIDCKPGTSEEICVSVVNQHSQMISNSGANTFNVALTNTDIIAATMVPEGLTLYQDTGQNLELFTAADGPRSGTVVLVPLNHTFIPE